MSRWSALPLLLALAGALMSDEIHAQASAPPGAAPPPGLEEVRREMGIPSQDRALRGQRDTVGYASRAAQMDSVWRLSALPPAPESLGTAPAAGVVAVIAPHDDYLYAGRVYPRVLPMVRFRSRVSGTRSRAGSPPGTSSRTPPVTTPSIRSRRWSSGCDTS